MKSLLHSCLPTPIHYSGRLFLLVALFMVGFVQVGKGQNYWLPTGATPQNWNNAANWSGGIPFFGDNVVFQAGKASCNIDVDVNVFNITLESGYTNTLTQQSGKAMTLSNLIIQGGTYVYASGAGSFSITNISVSGGLLNLSALNNTILSNFTMSGGAFTAPNTIMYVNFDINITGGTFNHNDGTVIMQGTSNRYLTTTATTDFNNLTISEYTSAFLTSNSVLNVQNNLIIANSGSLSGSLNASSTGTQINTKHFVQQTNTSFTAPSGTMIVSGDFDVAGSFYANFGTVRLIGGNAYFGLNNAGGNTNFHNLIFNKNAGQSMILNASMTSFGILEYQTGSINLLNTGNAVQSTGDIHIYNTFEGGNAPLNVNGNNLQTIEVKNGNANFQANIDINKSNNSNVILTGGTNYYKLTCQGNTLNLTSGKVELQTTIEFKNGANITGASTDRYFITSPTNPQSRIICNFGLTPVTFGFPVGSQSYFSNIGFTAINAKIAVSYTDAPDIKENDMSSNLIRRSFIDMWRIDAVDVNDNIINTPITIANPFITDVALYSGVADLSTLTLAIKKDGINYWENFATGSNSISYSQNPPSFTVSGSGTYSIANGYITFGAFSTGSGATNDLYAWANSSSYVGANHKTNCVDARYLALGNSPDYYAEDLYVFNVVSGGVISGGCVNTPLYSQWVEFNTSTNELIFLYTNTSTETVYMEQFGENYTCGNPAQACHTILPNETKYIVIPASGSIGGYKFRFYNLTALGTNETSRKIGSIRLMPKPTITVNVYNNPAGAAFKGQENEFAQISLGSSVSGVKLTNFSIPFTGNATSTDLSQMRFMPSNNLGFGSGFYVSPYGATLTFSGMSEVLTSVSRSFSVAAEVSSTAQTDNTLTTGSLTASSFTFDLPANVVVNAPSVFPLAPNGVGKTIQIPSHNYLAFAQEVLVGECNTSLDFLASYGVEDTLPPHDGDAGPEDSDCTVPASQDIWVTFIPSGTSTVHVEYSNRSAANIYLGLYYWDGSNYQHLNNCISNFTAGGTERLTFTSVAERKYYVRIYNVSAAMDIEGFICVRTGTIPVGDICTNTLPATTLGVSTTFNVASSMRNYEGRIGCADDSDLDRWTRFVASSTITAISYTNTGKNASVSVYANTPHTDLNQTPLMCVNNINGIGTEVLTFETTIGTNYFVRVQNLADNGTMNGTLLIYQSPPAAPINFASSNTGGTFTITWNTEPTAKNGYNIDVSTSSNFSSFYINDANVSTNNIGNSYTLPNANYPAPLLPNTNYYVRVRSINNDNAPPNNISNNSATFSFKTGPAAPVIINPSQGDATQNSFLAKWNLSPGGTAYYLDVLEEDLPEGSAVYNILPTYNNVPIGFVSTFTVTGLTTGKKYQYKVRASNGTTISEDGIGYITLIPQAPSIISVNNQTNSSFDLNFNAPLGASGYKITVVNVNNANDKPYDNFDIPFLVNSPYPIVGLSANTQYQISFRAYNAMGTSGEASIFPWTAPDAPSMSSPTDVFYNSFTANWSDFQSGVSYDVELSDNNFSSVLNSLPTTNLSFNFGVSNPPNVYYYRVRAVGTISGLSSINSGVEIVLLPPIPPDAPTATPATNVVSTGFEANWTPAGTGGTPNDYTLYVFQGGNLFQTINFANAPQLITAPAGPIYSYYVVANNVSGSSSPSNLETVAQLTPVAPNATDATLIGQTQFTANWDAINGCTYELEVATDNSFTLPITGSPFTSIATNSKEISLGLASNTTYYYRVRAVNIIGTSAESNIITLTTLPTAPATAPTGLTALIPNITKDSFQASWNSVAGATDYEVQVSTDNFVSFVADILSTGNGLNYDIISLNPATEYQFRVRAKNAGGFSPYSASEIVTTRTESPFISIDVVKSTSVTISWGAVTGAISYEIDFSEGLAFPGTPILSASNIGNVTNYTVTGLSASTPYIVRVRALNVNNLPSANGIAPKLSTAPAPPIANTVALADISTDGFLASWSSVSGATDYRIQISTENTFTTGVLSSYDDVSTSSNTFFSTTGLAGGTTYYYRVYAVINFAEPSIGTDYSNIVEVLTKPAIPTAFTPSTINPNSFTAKWSIPTMGSPFTTTLRVVLNAGTPIDISVPNTTDSLFVDSAVLTTALGSPVILSSGTDVVYSVITTNASGSSTSGTRAFQTKLNTPTLNAATQIEETSFMANWGFVLVANMYYLDVSTDPNFLVGTFQAGYNNQSTGVTQSFPVLDLTPNTTYYYRVRAGNGANISENSIPASITTKPSTPNFLSATFSPANPTTEITAVWTPVGTVPTGYKISLVEFPSLIAVPTYTNVDYPSSAINATFSGLDNTKEYRVLLKAYNSNTPATESGQSSINVLLKPIANNPNPADINATGFKASWNAITGVNSWILEMSTDNFATLPTSIPVTTNEYVFNTLSAGNTYYYRVTPVSATAPNASLCVSDPITVVIPAIPTVPIASSVAPATITTSEFQASWSQVVGCDGYEVDIYKNNIFQNTITITGSTNTSTVVSGLLNNDLYSFKVRAYTGNIESNDSNEIFVFLKPTILSDDTHITNAGTASFTAKWETVAGVTAHRIDLLQETPFGSNNYVGVPAYTNTDAGIGNSFVFTGLNFGTNYRYRVRAENTTLSIASPNSDVEDVLTLPQAPVIDVFDVLSATSFSLDWGTNPSQSATGYTLQVFSGSSAVSVYNGLNVGNVTTFTLGTTPNPNLQPNTHYICRIRAVNATGTSDASGQVDVLTLPTTTTATQATNITYNFANTTLQFTANWLSDGVAGGDGIITNYNIDISTDNFATAPLTLTTPTNALSYVIDKINFPAIAGNTVYQYRVRAENASGEALVNSNIMTALTVPDAPTNVQFSNVLQDKFTVLMPTNPSVGITSYLLDVATTDNFSANTFEVFNQSVNVSLTGYTVPNLQAGKIYYYRLRAVNASGSSDYSATFAVITRPTALPAVSILTNSFDAQWQEVVGADSYSLEISTQENFGTILETIPVAYGNAVAGIETETVNNNLTYLGNYYYRVRAIKNSINSAYSNVINVKLAPNAPVALPLVLGESTTKEDEVVVKWNFAAGANAYYLDVARENNAGALSNFVSGYNNQLVNVANNFPVVGLNPDSTYYFRMRAANGTSISANSNVVTFQTAPTAPVLGTATVSSATQFSIGISHAQSATLTAYEIKLIDVTNSNNPVVKYNDNAVAANATQYTFTAGEGVEGGKLYKVELRAKNSSQYSDWVVTVNNILTIPSAPNALPVATEDIGQNSFIAKWNSVPTATKYYVDIYQGATLLMPDVLVNAPDTTYSVTGLVVDTPYSFKVTAENATGESAESNEIFVTTLPAIPPVPTGLIATNVTANSFTANWTASAGATEYRVDVSEDSNFATFVPNFEDIATVNTSLFITGLQAGKTYYFRIRAKNAGGISANSLASSILLLPLAPVALDVDADDVTHNSFIAKWNSVPTTTQYYVDIYQGANLIVNNATATDTTYTATGLTANTLYSFKVTAENATGESLESNEIFVTTKTGAPTGLIANNITTNSFTANWNAVAGATEYRVDVSEDNNFASFVPNFEDALAVNISLPITGLQAGNTYYFRVRAKNTTGISENSAIASALLIPPAPKSEPATARVINGANSSFTANWRAATGASNYQLLVYTYTNNTRTYLPNYAPASPNVGNVVSQNVTNVNLVTSIYYYRVIAKNVSGDSAPSDSIVVESADMPNAPSGLTLFNKGLGEVEVTWQDNSDNEEDFEILRAEDENFTVGVQTIQAGSNNSNTPQEIKYTDTGLLPLKKYWYKVRAVTSSINSLYSLPESIITAPDAPDAPENLVAIAENATSIYLEWDDVEGETNGYRIYRALDAFGADFVAVGTVGNDITEFIDTGLTTNTVYKYFVVARRANESDRSNIVFARAAAVPTRPINLVAEGISDTQVKLTWTDQANNEEEFVIEGLSVDTENVFEVVKTAVPNSATAPSQVVVTLTSADGIEANHLYTFRIFARNAEGRSRYSNSDTTLTKLSTSPTLTIPNVPSNLVAESVSTIEIKLRWADNAFNEDYFIIERSFTNNNFVEIDRIPANKTNYSDLNVQEGIRYYYQIRAANGKGNSAPSNIATTEAICNMIMVLVPDNGAGSGAVACDSKHVELTLNTNVTEGEFYWYRNGEIIPNAHLPRYVATETGEYNCRVIAGECDKETGVISVIVNPSFSVGVTYNVDLQALVANYTGADKYQWYFNYQPIAGATQETYKPTQQGTYYVVVTEGACSATSNPYPFTSVTAIEDFDISNQIKVYPNPTKGETVQLDVHNDLLGEVEIRLFDQYGKVKMQTTTRKTVHEWSQKLALTTLPSGIYIIEVRFGKYTGKRKLSIIN